MIASVQPSREEASKSKRAVAVGLAAVATAAGLGHGVVAAVLGRCPLRISGVRRPFEAGRALPSAANRKASRR